MRLLLLALGVYVAWRISEENARPADAALLPPPRTPAKRTPARPAPGA